MTNTTRLECRSWEHRELRELHGLAPIGIDLHGNAAEQEREARAAGWLPCHENLDLPRAHPHDWHCPRCVAKARAMNLNRRSTTQR